MDLLFSAPVISCLVVAGAAAFGVSVVVRFLPHKRKLESTIGRADWIMGKMQQQIRAKEAAIKQLKSEVEALKAQYARLSHYHEQLTQLKLELEREEMAEEARDDDDEEGGLFERRSRTRI